MSTYVDHLLDGVHATTNSYANAHTTHLADTAIRRQARFLVELSGQEYDGQPIDITVMDGTIDAAVTKARLILLELSA